MNTSKETGTVASTSHSTSKSEHSAGWLLRAWKFLVRQEIRFARWMVAHGMPSSIVTALLWLLKIALVVILGYVFFWLAITLAIAFVAATLVRPANLDADPYAWEWRQGFLGFGVYDRSGQRIDHHDHDPTEND